MLSKLLFITMLTTIKTIIVCGQMTIIKNKLQKPNGLMCDLLIDTVFLSSSLDKPPMLSKAFEPSQPVRILNQKPAFSWIVNDKKHGVKQFAYQILIADQIDIINANKSNVWNSGKIRTSQSSGIIYNGITLKPNKQYYWKIRVWNNFKEVSPYSKVSMFQTGSSLSAYATERYPLIKSDQIPQILNQVSGIIKADFGKDAFGQLKLLLFSYNNTDTIIVRMGELLNQDGSINRKPTGTIRYSEHKLPLKSGLQMYQLKISSDKRNTGPNAIKMPAYIGEVTPFRYCEIEGYKHPLKRNEIKRIVVNYPFNEQAAQFHSSDTLLNNIWELCKYSVKATSFAGTYVDGDRERIPYEADAYINQLCHYAVDREYSLARYSHEYLITHPNWPTEWILQSVLIAWNDYLYTGDIRSAKYFYDDLSAKTLMSLQDTNGLITTKKITQEVLDKIHYKGSNGLQDIVDWPHTGVLGLGKSEGGETDGFVFTDYNAVTNAFFYRALMIMKALANDLGKHEDALMFESKAKTLKEAYQKLLWDDKKKIYCDGVSTRHASLHANVFALTFGLVDEKYKSIVLSFIKSRGMACSVYGSQFLLDAVYDNGDDNYGLSLLTAKRDRSWYNMINVGSTITMEAWDNKYKPNQDWNHVWGAAPANIISRKLMGIEPLVPGWSEFKIAPQPGDLSQAQIIVPTIKGNVSMAFTKEIGKFKMEIEIPANTIAQVYLPIKTKSFLKVMMDGELVKALRIGKSVYFKNIGSGLHTFLLQY